MQLYACYGSSSMYIIWLVLAHMLNLLSTLSHDLLSTFKSRLGRSVEKVHYLDNCRGLILGNSEVKSWADWIGFEEDSTDQEG